MNSMSSACASTRTRLGICIGSRPAILVKQGQKPLSASYQVSDHLRASVRCWSIGSGIPVCGLIPGLYEFVHLSRHCRYVSDGFQEIQADATMILEHVAEVTEVELSRSAQVAKERLH